MWSSSMGGVTYVMNNKQIQPFSCLIKNHPDHFSFVLGQPPKSIPANSSCYTAMRLFTWLKELDIMQYQIKGTTKPLTILTIMARLRSICPWKRAGRYGERRRGKKHEQDTFYVSKSFQTPCQHKARTYRWPWAPPRAWNIERRPFPWVGFSRPFERQCIALYLQRKKEGKRDSTYIVPKRTIK